MNIKFKKKSYCFNLSAKVENSKATYLTKSGWIIKLKNNDKKIGFGEVTPLLKKDLKKCEEQLNMIPEYVGVFNLSEQINIFHPCIQSAINSALAEINGKIIFKENYYFNEIDKAAILLNPKNIISSEAISVMKKGSRIINCARGGLVDEVACRAALETGHLAGAAFDVFTEEPAKENILFDAPNFVATPHLGAATIEAQENVAIQIAQQMSDYLNTGAVVNALNYPSVSAEEAPILKPYVRLAYLMGSFLGQVTQEGILSVKLELEGKASNLLDVPLMASALVGILEPSSAAVNNISSASIASSRGINLSTIKHERRCDYETLLKITIKHDNGERTITGTLIAGNKPRIINIQGISIESEFPKNALYLRNYDKPGFIGDLGNKLGNNNINIASFHLGRRNVGGEAIALVEIDGKIDD